MKERKPNIFTHGIAVIHHPFERQLKSHGTAIIENNPEQYNHLTPTVDILGSKFTQIELQKLKGLQRKNHTIDFRIVHQLNDEHQSVRNRLRFVQWEIKHKRRPGPDT